MAASSAANRFRILTKWPRVAWVEPKGKGSSSFLVFFEGRHRPQVTKDGLNVFLQKVSIALTITVAQESKIDLLGRTPLILKSLALVPRLGPFDRFQSEDRLRRRFSRATSHFSLRLEGVGSTISGQLKAKMLSQRP